MLSVVEGTWTDGSAGEAELFFDVECLEDGLVELSLRLDSTSGLCGLLATLEYDSDALVFVSCGVGDDEALELSYRAKMGRVRFLLESDPNCSPQGVLATFYFRLIDEARGGYVRILPIEQRCAFYLDGAGCLQTADVSVPREVKINASMPDRENRIGAYLSSVSVKDAGEELVLSLVGEVVGQNHFAAGFKVFVVDVGSAEASRVIAARIISGDTVELEIGIPFEGRICVIITPLSFNGRAVVEGQKQVFLLE